MLVDGLQAARLEPEEAQVLIGFGDPPISPRPGKREWGPEFSRWCWKSPVPERGGAAVSGPSSVSREMFGNLD